MSRFFRLHDKDQALAGRWFLKGPIGPDGQAVDPRLFTVGNHVDLTGPFRIPIRRPGAQADFTLADFEMPVLLAKYAASLECVAARDIQRFPTSIVGVDDEYDIINIVSVVDCLDEQASEITYWTKEAGSPDMVGKYLAVTRIKVDPRRTNGHHVFRLARWKTAIIVSEAARRSLADAEGALFEEV